MDVYTHLPSWQNYKALLNAIPGIELTEPTKEYYADVLGHSVHFDEWHPKGEPIGTAILVHGAGGNGRILAPLAQLVTDMGWKAIAPDLPGYGLTRTRKGFQWDYNEWPKVVEALSKSVSGKRVMIGLSVGGLTAVYAAQRAKGVSGVFVTTLLNMNDTESFINAARWTWLGKLSLFGFRFLGPLIDGIRIPLKLAAPLSKMSGIDALSNYFQTDDLIAKKWVPIRFFRTLHKKELNADIADLNLWLVHPGADSWTPTSLSLKTYQKLNGKKYFFELTNGSHLPVEHPAFEELKGQLSAFLNSLSTVATQTEAG